MDMNLIGARRFIAAFVKSRAAVLAGLGICACTYVQATDCVSGLAPQDKIAQFKQLDSKAEAAMGRHQPAEAAGLYKEAVCLFPNSARAYYGLGVAEAAAGHFADARDALRTADRLQSTTAMPLVMQVRVNYSLGDLESLKSNLRELASRFPKDTETHTALARFLAEHNLFVLALAEALRSGSGADDWNAKVQLSILENTVGAYGDAIRNALAVERNYALPDAVRGTAAGIAGLSYESLRQGDEARKYLSEAIQLDPSQENSYLALADLFEQEQHYSDAVNVLEQGRGYLPDSNALLLALGTNMVRTANYEQGVKILRQVLQVAPGTSEAYISIADAERAAGNSAEEIDALRELERQHSDYPMIHVLLARAMLNQRPADYAKILEELALAARAAPNDPEVYFLQGKVYVAMGRNEQAMSVLERSIGLRPTEPSAYYQLARVYQKLGKTDLARQQFERVKYLEQNTAK
jgi:tetratricopeptide (TPR) repeat protein